MTKRARITITSLQEKRAQFLHNLDDFVCEIDRGIHSWVKQKIFEMIVKP